MGGRRPFADPVVRPSEGLYPFGFTFVRRQCLLVTDPLGAVSSYCLRRDGSLIFLGEIAGLPVFDGAQGIAAF